MKLKNVGKFMINGATMTAVALLMRTVGVSFNVYIANTAGAEAIGLYSLLSGVYGFSLTLALSGINLAVTRLVSERLALDDKNGAIKVLRKASLYSLCFGSIAAILLFCMSETVASSWLCDQRIILPLKLLSFSLPASAFSSVINGYFAAVRRVYKNALSQFIEMILKFSATVLLFSVVSKKDSATACSLLAFSGVISELSIFIINLALYVIDRKLHIQTYSPKTSSDNYGKKILGISLPVALTSYVRSALMSIEHSLITKGLIKYGSDRSAALSEYGTLGSMALTVINFPYALIGSFASLLIPEVAESRTKGNKRHIRYIAYRTYQTTAVFSLCLLGLFFCFADELGRWLYSSSLAGQYIKQLSFLVPVMYTDTVTDSLLKGMGEQLYSMKVNIADALISVTLVYFLVPRYGINGYIVTIYIAEIINAALSIARMVKVCGIGREIISLYMLSALASVGALSFYGIAKSLFNPDSFLPIIIYFIIYLVLIRVTSVFSRDDLLWIRSVFKKTN